MVNRSSRNVLIACAGAIVFVVVLVLLWPHRKARANAGIAQGASTASKDAAPSKPSAYGEAFRPAPPSKSTSLPSTGYPPSSAGNLPPGDFAGQRYPSVAARVMAANVISAPPPSYPFLARLAHVEGRVTVQAVISRDGLVSATRVLDGHHLLRGAAIEAVRRRRYRPYRIGGRPANVATIVTVDFPPSS